MTPKTRTNLMLLVAAVAVIVGAWFLGSARPSDDGEKFGGSDATATATIERDHPDTTPWATPWFTPGSSEVESGLFALQAALGGGALGYAIGVLRTRRQLARSAPAPLCTVDEQ